MEVINYDNVNHEELVYAGYSSNDLSNESINKTIEQAKRLEETICIKCQVVIKTTCGKGLYIYADKIYNDFREMYRLQNYLNECIEPNIVKLNEFISEKEQVIKRIDVLKNKVEKYITNRIKEI